MCDFHTLDRDKFSEPVTDEKWAKWLRLREENQGRHHADIAFDFLSRHGFTETAETIRLHRSTALVEESGAYDSFEKKLVYYSDKRVKHTEIVDLKERFRDGAERYSRYNTPEQQAVFTEVEQKTHTLEKELFRGLDIGPSDIR